MAEGISIFTPSATPPTNPAPVAPVQRSSPVSDARVADGVRSNPTITPAQALWKADFDALTKADPWRDPSIVITKDPDGTIRTRPRGPASGDAPSDAGQPGQPQPQTPPAGPATVGDDGRLAVGDLRLSADDIKSILAEKSARDSRRATMPEDPANYALDLPADFKMPEGLQWAWNTDNSVSGPLIGLAKQFAHEHGIDQAGFSRMMGLFASHQLGEEQRIAALKKAQVDLLGVNAPTRVDAVNTWLRSMVGDKLAESIRRTMVTADQVKAYETLISRWTSQGVSGSPSAHRDADHGRQPQRMSDADYSQLTYTQKLQYAQQFDQSRVRNGRG